MIFGKPPAGIRLDGWPAAPASQPAQDCPEVARLREELRRRMPELVAVLELLEKIRPLRDLAGRRRPSGWSCRCCARNSGTCAGWLA
jgi:hypothetical protein